VRAVIGDPRPSPGSGDPELSKGRGRIRVAHLGQIGRPGPGVQLVEKRVVARVGLRLRDPARRVANIAKLDGRGRAGLLAGRLDIAVTERAPRELRIDLPRLILCVQYVHFSMTPLARTVTSGFIASLRMSGVSLVKLKKIEAANLVGQLFEQ
jgi:hypothetical protein